MKIERKTNDEKSFDFKMKNYTKLTKARFAEWSGLSVGECEHENYFQVHSIWFLASLT